MLHYRDSSGGGELPTDMWQCSARCEQLYVGTWGPDPNKTWLSMCVCVCLVKFAMQSVCVCVFIDVRFWKNTNLAMIVKKGPVKEKEGWRSHHPIFH